MSTLSVVIPTKNEEDYLPLLLASIKKQTFQPKEVIVADAHSTDHTSEIAKKAGARVVEGGMPGPGRNRGAKIATGDLLLFLDADVVLRDNEMLEKTLKEFERQGLDIGTPLILPLSQKTIDIFFHKIYNRYVLFLGKHWPHAPGFFILVKRSVHEHIHGFDEQITLAEDHDYAMRAAKIGKFGIMKNIFVPVSVRRFDKDGRLTIAMKYFFGELHLIFLGPIKHNKFKYEFGYKKKP
ncbi:MAG: glycosyltransferase [Patescibacteria group bacterium]|jgi:glycosyltransferase involved in cell wall biosynthesis